MERSSNIASVKPEELQRAAEDIYIYGYPLVLMDVVRRMKTATAHPSFRTAPLNQFAHRRFLPSPNDKDAAYPNLDCLCSSAWLDLHKDPVVLSVPKTNSYHLLSIWSAWYEIFETISPRTKGTEGGHFAFVGPYWQGSLPGGVTQILAPTTSILIEAYFEASGAEDIQRVHLIQDKFRLTPLREWGRSLPPHSLPFSRDVDRKTAPQEQVESLVAQDFYSRLSTLLRRNPAHENDAEILAEFCRIGFLPREGVTFEMLPAATAEVMPGAASAAQQKIISAGKNGTHRQIVNGWSLHVHPGSYDTDYLQRAVDARTGMPVALIEDVIQFHAASDHTGQPLNGANKYVIEFPQDGIPPANAFWSINLYDAAHHAVHNDIHRYLLGDRGRLRMNPDNSLSLYVQHEWPGTSRDSNWLPAPKDSFNLALRLYWPKPDAVTGKWRPPSVIRMN